MTAEDASEARLKANVVICALLVGAVILTFSAALYAGFVGFDDPYIVENNEHIRGFSGANLSWMFTRSMLGHYQPLTWISYAIDYTLWGLEPRGFHLTSILVHAVNAVLVYFLALRVLTLRAAERATTRVAAGLGAALFALHPLRVESVAWVTERRDVLSLMWLLAATLAYLKAWAAVPRGLEDGGGSLWAGASRRWYLASVAFLALSLLSKAWGITYFAVLLILDWSVLGRLSLNPACWFRQGQWRVIAEKLPMLALGLGAAFMAAKAQSTAHAMKSVADWGLAQRGAQAAYGLWFYLAKTIWPSHLAAMYEIPDHLNPLEKRFIVAYVGLFLIAVIVLLGARARRAIPGAALTYAVILLPVLGIAQSGDQLVADRYSYIATIPVVLLVAAALSRLLDRPKPSRIPLIAGTVAAITVCVFAGVAWQQTDSWHDTESLWKRAATAIPGPLTCQLLGEEYNRQNRPEDAIVWLRKSLEFDPENGQTLYLLGDSYAKTGHYAEAAEAIQKGLRTMRQPYMGYAALGVLYANNLGRPADAEAALRAAVVSIEERVRSGRSADEAAPIYLALGAFLKQQGKVDEARLWLEKARGFDETKDMATRALQDLTKATK